MAAPLDAEGFRAHTGVSRETLARLEAYAELLRKWQRAINLVGAETLPDLWRRHFLDAAQLHPLLPAGARSLLDLGSGAGFPGLVLAVLGLPEVHLVEADGRKAAFLREAGRVTGAIPGPVRVHACRIEALRIDPVDVVTARGCAPLDRLLALAGPFLREGSICLFPKGRRVNEELTEAGKTWSMTVQRWPSVSDSSGVILQLGHIRREPGSSARP